MSYRPLLDGSPFAHALGKVVCVGRNYAEHARELNNPLPTEPVLFIKPASAVCALDQPLRMPVGLGACHFETEMALLIGAPLSHVDEAQALAAVAGIGLALDLTLRDLQAQLKEKSLPWEKAKSFDGACPLSGFVTFEGDFAAQQIRLWQNGELRQDGCSADMLTPVARLLAYISQFFSLQPGDVVLTGTPAGVGPLASGDRLRLQLSELLDIETRVI